MAREKDIDIVAKLTGEKDTELLEILLDEAEGFVLSYTHRSRIVSGLDKAVRDLAVIALNRMGTEGESGRSEGGESYSFESAPKQIYDTLNNFRIARVGGRYHENAAQQT
ncbi:MAG: phage head-tail connector protein [Lachnospiraceae bacterium]|nr:phage head-tail connector protein [Lachnospiraceae bacterium]